MALTPGCSSHISERFLLLPGGKELMKEMERKQESYSEIDLHMKANAGGGNECSPPPYTPPPSILQPPH